MSASSTAHRFAAVALAAGAVVCAAALPATAADRDHHRHPRMEISAVQADSPGRDNHTNRSLNAEWVDITNNTRHTVNLKGWTLRDGDGNRYRFRNVRLVGGDTLRVHTGAGRDTHDHLYQDRRDYMWDNHADKAVLRNDRHHTVDTKSWNRGGHHR